MAALIQYKNNVPGVRIIVDKPVFRIGRGETNDLRVEDELSSREHAVIERVRKETDKNSTGYVIRDQNSTNGTFVNHNPVTAHLLADGDVIRIGQTFLKFMENEQSELGETRVLKKSIIPGVFYTTDKRK